MIKRKRRKRHRAPQDPSNQLTVSWCGREEDIVYDGAHPLGRVVAEYFETLKPKEYEWNKGSCRTMREELEERGFDLKTLYFTIKRKEEYICPECKKPLYITGRTHIFYDEVGCSIAKKEKLDRESKLG